MTTSDTDGLAGSVLIYISAIMFSLGVLAVPIYFITGPIVITNDGPRTLTRVVTQPLIAAADGSFLSNPKADAALAELKRSQAPPSRSQAPPSGSLEVKKQVNQHVSSGNAPPVSSLATYLNFAPL